MDKPTELAVGDKCWLLCGTCLYAVSIRELSRYFEGDPYTFTMYRVTSHEHSIYFEETSQHRSDLFKRPDERAQLIARLDSDRDSICSLMTELEREAADDDDTARAAQSPAEKQAAHLRKFGK